LERKLVDFGSRLQVKNLGRANENGKENILGLTIAIFEHYLKRVMKQVKYERKINALCKTN